MGTESSKFSRILVPVTGRQADDEAMKVACRLIMKKNQGKIFAVSVIAVERNLPLDAEIRPEIKKAEGILSHMEDVAKGQGCFIETELLQAREVGPAIVDEAKEREVNLILMGVTYKRRFGEFSLGSIVPYVLKNADCNVLFYHQVND